jgi:hypothetical protein
VHASAETEEGGWLNLTGDAYGFAEEGAVSRKHSLSVPYSSATSGSAARAEIVALLQRFRCESVGFMDDFAENTVLLQFTHRGRPIQIKASAKGWAALYLRDQPWTARHRTSKAIYEANALRQGLIAVNSILRDWVKGQVTAVECGAVSFDAVFMPFMLLPGGKTILERAQEHNLLPAPRD